MKPTPKGWPRLSSAVFYDEASKAIDWLCKAFGFEVALRVEGPDGKIAHSQLTLGEGLIMVSDLGKNSGRAARPGDLLRASPRELGGKVTQSIMAYVDDVDAHCARARAAGATIAVEPATTDYGPEYWADRGYEAVDPEGHRWWFIQRMRG
jgi:uncharacterized glyoxalase superfamily protein PhnB